MGSSGTSVNARRATEDDAALISRLLACGPSGISVTAECVRGTIALGSHCFILSLDAEILGFVELRAVHPEPERSDAAVVVWMVKRRPLGIGAAALGFILRYAFCSLGLREVWGWVRQDNARMLRLCRHLGVTDNGPWAADPDFRLLIHASGAFANRRAVLGRVEGRVSIRVSGGIQAPAPLQRLRVPVDHSVGQERIAGSPHANTEARANDKIRRQRKWRNCQESCR